MYTGLIISGTYQLSINKKMVHHRLKLLIKINMKNDKSELLKICVKINDIKNRIHVLNEDYSKKYSSLRIELEKNTQQLQEICPHYETEPINKIIEGDYLNKTQYICQQKCKICDMIVSEKIQYGGYI